MSGTHGAARRGVLRPSKPVQRMPVPPRKGLGWPRRPAELAASPSRVAQRTERGVKERSDTGGVSAHPRTRSNTRQKAASCDVAKLTRISVLGCRLAWNSAPGASR